MISSGTCKNNLRKRLANRSKNDLLFGCFSYDAMPSAILVWQCLKLNPTYIIIIILSHRRIFNNVNLFFSQDLNLD